MNATETMPGLEIELPPGFAGMPVTNDDELNLRYAWAASARFAASAGKNQAEFGRCLMALVPAMQSNGVRVFGKFAVGDRPEDLATLTLCVVRSSESTDPASLVDSYRQQHVEADVRLVQLPFGPAMAAIEAGEFRLPPQVTGRPDELVTTQVRATYQIPSPDGGSVVILSVTAESEEDWPAVAEAVSRTAHSLRLAP